MKHPRRPFMLGLLGLAIPLSVASFGCSKQPEPITKSGDKPAAEAPKSGGLTDPSKATEKAPDTYKAKFVTSKGDFVIEVKRDWSPNGADRFYNLVKIGYYNDVRFFRVLKGFMAQFGMAGDPAISAKWADAQIADDPVKESNKKGYVTFAKTGLPNSRSTQVFINYADNANLDSGGFSPFGQVVEGMSVAESLYGDYGEGAPRGQGPSQDKIRSEGNAYLNKDFPKLDYIKEATILP